MNSREQWLDEMVEILGVDREDVLEVGAMFFDAIEERLAKIAVAHQSDNMEELTRLVHGLKGDAANIGFKATSALARRLEHECRNGVVVDFESQFEALERAIHEQRAAIGLERGGGAT